MQSQPSKLGLQVEITLEPGKEITAGRIFGVMKSEIGLAAALGVEDNASLGPVIDHHGVVEVRAVQVIRAPGSTQAVQ
jgi:hypothetical protein